MRKVMVVSPHPDDEVLGAAGTLLHYKAQGYQLIWVNMTNMKEEYGYDAKRIQVRYDEIEQVKGFLGIDVFFDLSLKPAGLDTYDTSEIILHLAQILNAEKPEVLILPYEHDIHSDHRIVFNWFYSLCKSFRHPYIRKVMCMEILSETDFANPMNGFVPNVFVDISPYLKLKLDAMTIYKSELGVSPFPRSLKNIKALASLRGGNAGVEYAEGFKLVKEIL